MCVTCGRFQFRKRRFDRVLSVFIRHLQEQHSELLIYTKKMTSLSTKNGITSLKIETERSCADNDKDWHNGELLHMYRSGERVPDIANAKSCVLVKVLVPSDEQGFLDFPGPESVLCQ